jgi:WD40 repeat protein
MPVLADASLGADSSIRRQMMHRRILTTVLVTGLLAASWARAEFKVKAESLGPGSENAIAYGSSPDGRHWVTVGPVDGKLRVYVDGKPGPAYEKIQEARAFMSPDGKRWAVYFTNEDFDQFLVLDGKRVPGVNWVIPDRATFSPDGRHFAYVTGGARWTVTLDDTKVADFDGDVCPINQLWFSPDGEHLCFSVFDDGIYLDAKRLPRINSLTFSPDGKRRADVKAAGEEAVRVVIDGEQGPELRELVQYPRFSSDGRRAAYAGRDSSGCRVYLDGTPGPVFDEVGELVFSGDGQALGYLAQVSDTWKVVVNHEVKHFFSDGSEPSMLKLDQAGTNMAYLLENGDRYLVMHNDKQGQVHEMQVERVVLSPDGSRVAYSVRTYASTIDAYNSGRVVVDGNENAEYTQIISETMQFSPDSKHYAYFADAGSDIAVVLDGKQVGRFPSLARGGPYFHPDGTLEYLGTRGGKLYRMTHTPVK